MLRVRSSALAFLALLPLAPATRPAGSADDKVRAEIVQTIDGFDRPESCAWSLDGAHLFVGSCASDLFGDDGKKVGFVRGRGGISKLAVAADGTVSMVAPRLVAGLDGPLGLAVLPEATERYPRGTLLVAVGLALLCEPDGASVTDAARLGTAVLFLDPDTGARLGAIELGAGSAVAQALGHAVLMPNSLAFDARGDLYVTDSARGGDRLVPALEPHPGLVRISRAALDDPGKEGVTWTPIPGIPNGVAYWPVEDALLVVTMGGDVPGGQALYKLRVADLPAKETPAPFLEGIGTMDGVAVTPAGTILASRFSGDVLVVPREGAPFPLPLEPDTPLVAPADHRVLVRADGTCLLAVPEQARTEKPAGKQRVRIVRLPAGM